MVALICQERGGTEFPVLPGLAFTRGFREGCAYRLRLDHERRCALVIDDVALPCVREGTLHQWDWTSGFYAGTVVAELLDEHNTTITSYRLDVAPDPAKLGQAFFQQMVDELQTRDPQLLFGAEAAQHDIGSSGQFTSVHLADARLKRFGSQYLHALKQVAARPLTVLRSERRLEPWYRVSRIDQRTLSHIMANPKAVIGLGAEGDAGVADQLLFDVPASREDLDTPAHRVLARELVAVIQRIRSVREQLAALGKRDRPGQVRTPMGPRLPWREQRLDGLEARLTTLLRARPFSEVTRHEVSSAGLNVISGHPAYARVFRLGWQILRPGIEGENAGETLPVSPSWEVYERWCLLRVVEALQQIYPGFAWTRTGGSRADIARFSGRSAGIHVQARLQTSFPAIDMRAERSHFFSISGERRPDIVVTWSSGSSRKLLVFDAKYRVSRENVLQAMASAHIYRDCLRWNAIRPDYAMLLVPAGGGVPELEKASFHAEHGVGVIALSPATGSTEIVRFLSEVLGDVSQPDSCLARGLGTASRQA